MSFSTQLSDRSYGKRYFYRFEHVPRGDIGHMAVVPGVIGCPRLSKTQGSYRTLETWFLAVEVKLPGHSIRVRDLSTAFVSDDPDRSRGRLRGMLTVSAPRSHSAIGSRMCAPARINRLEVQPLHRGAAVPAALPRP